MQVPDTPCPGKQDVEWLADQLQKELTIEDMNHLVTVLDAIAYCREAAGDS